MQTHGNAVCVFLANALGLGLALLKRVLVLELGSHDDGSFEMWRVQRLREEARWEEICVALIRYEMSQG